MASGPIVGDGDGPRERKRYTESKVYTRKAFKGPRKNNPTLTTLTTLNTTTTTTTTTAAADTNTATTTTTTPSNKDNNNENNVKSNENVNKDSENDNENNENINKDSKNADKDSENVDRDNESNRENENTNNKSNEIDELAREPSPKAVLASEDGNLAQKQQHILRLDVGSDDSSSLNRQQEQPTVAVPVTRDEPVGNGVVKMGENRVKINLGSRSKQEMRDLRRKLEGELDMVRGLVKRIEAKQGQIGGYSHSHMLVNDGVDNGGSAAKRVHSEVASVGVGIGIGVPREVHRPLHQLNLSVLENSQGVSENVEKEKRTPKANQFYRNSEFLLAKDKFPPAESNKKSKSNGKKQGGGELGHGFWMGTKFYKSCSSLLEKLMKHKHGWVFNAPVDVEGLGLHDYFTIIRHPMDLGTVKSRLNKNWYKSPKEFAEDVRLTFHNAMTYNPKGQDVHLMAEQLLKTFEDRWAIIESDFNREMRYSMDYGVVHSTPTSRKVSHFPPPPLDMRRILDRSESITNSFDPKSKPMSITPSARTPAPKKPKAKDPHKRDMTYDEKQKLSTNLQNLPSEKLDAIVQIIKKRNSALCQEDDEIEVDIDSVDAETLWELDRFVTNYKKSLSKHKRKAELAIQAQAGAVQNVQEKIPAPVVEEVPKESKIDEMIVSNLSPVQPEKQVDNGSRSSSSSSSSSDSGSSSSDSDSESSSASGSDAGSPRT